MILREKREKKLKEDGEEVNRVRLSLASDAFDFAEDIIDILANNLKCLLDVKKAMEAAPGMAIKEIVQQIVLETIKMAKIEQDRKCDDNYIEKN